MMGERTVMQEALFYVPDEQDTEHGFAGGTALMRLARSAGPNA
jgi:hypothetical protein